MRAGLLDNDKNHTQKLEKKNYQEAAPPTGKSNKKVHVDN
jgi:hypothetical protein